MADWKIYELSDIGTIKTGKTPPSSNKKAFANFGIPFVTPVDMKGQKWIDNTERFLSPSGFDEVKNYLVSENSIAVSCIGSDMGKAVLLKHNSITNQQINTLTVNKNNNAEYIYYVLSQMQDYLKSIAGGSATPILNKTDFSKIKIKLPDLETQNKVADFLKIFDQKIQLNTQINQTLEAIAQAIFKSWFVDFDPVRAKAQAISDGKTSDEANLSAMAAISGKVIEDLSQTEYQELWEIADAFPGELVENAEFGEVPKGWENGTLGDITSSYREKVKNKQAIVLSAVATGELVKSDEYFNKQVYSKSIEKYLQVNPLDFAFNPARVNIGSIGLHKENFLGAVSPVYEVFTTRKNYHWFVSRFIQLEKTKQWIKLLSNGSVRQTLKLSDLQSIPCIIPSNDIVEIFNNYWLLFYEKINSNKENCKKLEKTRDLLLPKLLSGEIEL